MKKIILVFVSLLSVSTLAFAQAQQFVLEGDGSKHAILEEFTGVNCGNCPAGHSVAANIVATNPDLVHVVALPPSNSSYTRPNSGATDFRRGFADAFYTGSYCSPADGVRVMPSAFISRKLGNNGNILQSRANWPTMVTNTLAEAPVLNVAAKSNHNTANNTLDVDVQLFFTSTVSNDVALYVMLTEDGLTSNYQAGSNSSASNPYVYKHMLRENISTGQWGDAVTGSTTKGSLYSTQYSFDLSKAIDPIVLENAHVVVYAVDATSTNKEVFNGIEVDALGGQRSTGSAPNSVNDLKSQGTVEIYPNPTFGDIFIDINNNEKDVTIKVSDMLGKTLYQTQAKGNAQVEISKSTFPTSGLYFVELSNELSKITKKVIVR